MDNVTGWSGMHLMLSRPRWLLVLPTAVLTPLIVFIAQHGELQEDLLVGWGCGIFLLAMMMGGEKDITATRDGKFEYIGMLALLGGFVGIPTLILGLPVLWMLGGLQDDHAMAISSAIGGVIGFIGLLVYAFKSGVSSAPATSRGASFGDGLYDGRD